MKQSSKNKFKPLTTTEIKALAVETKETNLTEKQFKLFSVVDLWSIQKNRKSACIYRSMAF
jgi:hypothetical protein